jgi:hypothetical protein
MSVHGLKPTFTDFEGYKTWRKVWADVYTDVSERIRGTKGAIRTMHQAKASGPSMSRYCEKLQGQRVIAHKLCTILDEAKIRMSNITTMRKGMTVHLNQFPLTIEDGKTVEFHFNKKHLEFPWIPMWVVKTKGQTYYVHHVEANAPWSTREAPDHASTKGSIRFKRCDLTINSEGVATITPTKVEAIT